MNHPRSGALYLKQAEELNRKKQAMQRLRKDAEEIVGPVEDATFYGRRVRDMDRDELLAALAVVWAFPPPHPKQTAKAKS